MNRNKANLSAVCVITGCCLISIEAQTLTWTDPTTGEEKPCSSICEPPGETCRLYCPGYVPAKEPADSKTSYLFLVPVLGSVIVFVVIILVVIIILICQRRHKRVGPDPEKSGTQPSDADVEDVGQEQIQPLIDGVTGDQPTNLYINDEPISAEPHQPETTHSTEDVSSGHEILSDYTGGVAAGPQNCLPFSPTVSTFDETLQPSADGASVNSVDSGNVTGDERFMADSILDEPSDAASVDSLLETVHATGDERIVGNAALPAGLTPREIEIQCAGQNVVIEQREPIVEKIKMYILPTQAS